MKFFLAVAFLAVIVSNFSIRFHFERNSIWFFVAGNQQCRMENSNSRKFERISSRVCNIAPNSRRQSYWIQKIQFPQRWQDTMLHQVHLRQNGTLRWKSWLQHWTFSQAIGPGQKWDCHQARNREMRWQKYTKINTMPMGIPWFWLLQEGTFGIGTIECEESLNEFPAKNEYNTCLWWTKGLEHDHLTLTN